MKYNFHSHSSFDDGKESMEDFVLSAIEKGLMAFGFSGHTPLPMDNAWSLPGDVFPAYVEEMKRLQQKYKGRIQLYRGLEIDYIPDYSDNFDDLVHGVPLDYCIGSVHLVRKPGSEGPHNIWFIDGPREGYLKGIEEVFDGDPRAAVEAFYNQSSEMVSTQKPDIIGHMDKVKMNNKGEFFDTQSLWYRDAVDRLLGHIKASGTIVELNTRGVYTGKTDEYFPSIPILEKCLHMDIPVMINTDAHHPSQVDTHFEEAVKLLKDIGFEKMKTPFFEVAL